MTPVLLDVDLAMGAPGSDIDDGFALALAVADPEMDLRLTSRSPASGHGVLALIEAVLAAPGKLTLVAVGPLTNVAMAVLLEPTFAESLARLVMGGVFAGTTGSADLPGEFNGWSDPEAASVVLQSGVLARWVGLDVIRQVRLIRGEADAMAADPHPSAAFAGRYSAAWIDHLAQTDDPDTDSCALVADHRTLAARPANARIAVDVDPAGFADHFNRCLRRL